MENSVRKREWVKTAAIIFLAVLLVLTFFSKTIMNASLPEVAAQQAASGAINARIRGSGTVEASEVYNVTIKQTRKVASVLVKTGQEINVGDTMFVLEAEDSDELKQAETDLETLQQNYDKSLIEAGNTTAKDNREVQKARDTYNEALAIYNQYSTMDPTQLAIQKIAAEQKLKDLEREKTQLEAALAEVKADTNYTNATEKETEAKSALDSAKTAYESALREAGVSENEIVSVNAIQTKINNRRSTYSQELAVYEADFLAFYALCGNDVELMEKCADPTNGVLDDMIRVKHPEEVNKEGMRDKYIEAYNKLQICYVGTANDKGLFALEKYLTAASAKEAYSTANREYSKAKSDLDYFTNQIDYLEASLKSVTSDYDNQSELVQKYTDASSAAETVKSAKKALEDLVFEQGLGDSASIDMAASKKAIERKQAEVDKLRENADELEVKSSVSGTIASINASAGKSIGGEEQPLATINVTDRGFTVKIDVTNDQAKKVKTGDTAELVNFWGGDAVATLDQITSSQTAGNRTLVFTLTGDIQAGQNVTLSIGQKSANYDALIPLSGLREDSNGKFVYVLESKSSPLGSRYIATRVTVQELARDDKSAAVSGISSGDFIITTSNKPVEAGKQVRLADNG